jgi:hypothetical protein
MKTLVVVDDFHSAIGLAANSRSAGNQTTILSANKYLTPLSLIKDIRKREPAIVFFAWRGALLDLLNSGYRTRSELKRLDQTMFGILIPDLLGLEMKSIEMESKLINFVDFYMVTSKELHADYSAKFPEKLPAGLYRDLPNLKLIQKVSDGISSNPLRRIIWVGNSRWGQHHGAVDHKGFHEIISPLKDKMQEVDFELIDSSIKRLSHERVLQEIRNSQILLQASKNEGTGLPILEAAGLGTAIVTTNVGVASDFLQGDLRRLIVERNLDSFTSGIEFALINYQEISLKLKMRFREYVAEIMRDSLPEFKLPNSRDLSLFSNRFSVARNLKWFRRWLIARQ